MMSRSPSARGDCSRSQSSSALGRKTPSDHVLATCDANRSPHDAPAMRSPARRAPRPRVLALYASPDPNRRSQINRSFATHAARNRSHWIFRLRKHLRGNVTAGDARANAAPLTSMQTIARRVVGNGDRLSLNRALALEASREPFDDITRGASRNLGETRLLRTRVGARHRPCRHESANVKHSASLPLIEENERLC